ncbi:acyl-CoA dehydrogenase [Burkholderia singularis]|uniref:Acyl-CoA dehydrogenase, short-chain specific n=1 Tax=Burkholderia singularis TaxID=1503053 RepID=A0A238GZI0_9BURK|nr:acyl-CoA dehydrogenase [Burkholderia singularis]SMF98395.1 Acyl-CoA dehydrogenase, short-chain specific [Burkholderia singularis]
MNANPITAPWARGLGNDGAHDGGSDIERMLGDPFDATNPLGYARVLEADERGTLCEQAEAVLERWGMNAEFVPRRLGGRWDTADEMVRRLRPVFRRDASLGIGYGVSSFVAAVNVWAGGSAQQQRELSDLLLRGGKVSVAYHELGHGNDFLRNAFQAYPDHDGNLLLEGVKEVINNAHRADAWVVFARTDERPGGRSHSILLLDRQQLQSAIDAGELEILTRYRTAGVRACHLAGLRFSRCRVPVGRIVASRGSGAEISLRSFQVTRIVLPGMAIGMLDTALRAVVGFARERRLYGARVIELPYVRSALSDVMVDLLSADCLVRAAARSLHLAPAHASVYAATVKYLVPLLLRESMNTLSIILGARAYLRDGPYAIFGKMMRDLPIVSVAHAGGTACLLTLLSQLPALGRRAARRAGAALELFDEHVPLPLFDFDALTIAAHGEDRLLDTLANACDTFSSTGEWNTSIERLVRDLATARDELRIASASLAPSETGPGAHPDSFALAQRYAWLAAAAACVGVWQAQRARAEQSFVGGSAWIVAALSRLQTRLGRPKSLLSPDIYDAVMSEIVARVDANRSLCLHHAVLNGGADVPEND